MTKHHAIKIADSQLKAMPIHECHEPLIDLKNQTIIAYGPPPETESTKNDYTKLRKTVFEKLCVAQKDLPQDWRFRLYEGFRSLQVQKWLFEQQCEQILKIDPTKNEEIVFNEAMRLVSPVRYLDGEANIPPHNTGGAVDIEVIDVNGNLIDMGMAISDWAEVDPIVCQTDCDVISAEAKSNRAILLKVMMAHEFVNYPFEWWHFSYGDRYWALGRDEKQAKYGSVEKAGEAKFF